ncbi:MAG TPA: cobalamin biosynthesis protein CbiG [Lachnospiraceae bacterium]|nr:cobalamin biosynthesis protein CbiG [Lachnospiraceae bacterium]
MEDVKGTAAADLPGDRGRAEIVCFSENGKQTAREAADYLKGQGKSVQLWLKSRYAAAENLFHPVDEPLADWAGARWKCGLLVFVGALGIAVRAIAPHVKSKKTDPAVLVLDEGKHFCIPLLSGHLGGANEAALGLAAHTGSVPVVTTATDVHSLFAVDVFAKKNGLQIDSMTLAKEVSAALLAGQTVGMYSELPVENTVTSGILCGLTVYGTEQEAADGGLPLGIYIGYRTDCAPFSKTLKLVPDGLAVGIGCRKGAAAETVAALFYQVMEGLDVRAVGQLASIDLKKDESGIRKLAESLGVPFVTYDPESLEKVPGTFSVSAFVKDITGVDNVCERSAVLASGNGTLIRKKCPGRGVTAAVAAGNRRIRFE